MDTLLMRQHMNQCGTTMPEIDNLLGMHPHYLDNDALSRLPEMPTRALVELAHQLGLHPADLVPGRELLPSHAR